MASRRSDASATSVDKLNPFFPPDKVLGQLFRQLSLTMEDVYDNNTGSPVPSITKGRLVVDGVEMMTLDDLSPEEALVSVVLAHSVFNMAFQRKLAPL